MLFGFMYWLNQSQPQNYVWEATFDTEDKQPFGAYVLDKLLEASWKKGYTHTYKSISDLNEEEFLEGKNLLILAQTFNPTEGDIDILTEYIQKGGKALIAARYYGDEWEKRFNTRAEYWRFVEEMSLKQNYDTLRFCTPELSNEQYIIPSAICAGFYNCDSLAKIKEKVFIVAKSNVNNEDVMMIRLQKGKGSLLLSCNPLIYSNYSVLLDTANQFMWNSLSYLQDKALIRTEYYHAGSNAKESRSPLRYLLSKTPLKWALNTTVVAILIFMLFTAKRKQKAIPIVKPPQNKMLDFVRSIASLYIRKNNNADIILKKQIYLSDNLKRNYGIDIINEHHDNDFFERLSAKTGKAANELFDLFRYLDNINENTHISDAQMMQIITQMNEIK